jgi:anti-sigma-K factor RskA
MRYDQPELQEALASAYVAGVLQGPARRRFETLMRTRPALRRRVEAWEDRLTPLSDSTPDVAPPVRVWRAVQQRVAPAAAPAARAGGFWNSLAFWRPFGAVAACLALLLIAYAGFTAVQRGTQEQVADAGQQQIAPSYVAVLQDDAEQPALVVTAFRGPWRITVEPLRDLTPYEGKVFQVWAVERGSGATRPLLQVTSGAVLQLPLDEDGWTAIKTSEFLSVTEEEAGTAPAAPTGPVLFQGPCLNLKGPTEA